MKENIDEFELMHLIHPDMGWTKERIAEGLKNVKDITEVSEIMGFFSLRDAAMAKGEWHGFSGVGFFLISERRRRDAGSLPALVSSAKLRSDQCMGSDPWRN